MATEAERELLSEHLSSIKDCVLYVRMVETMVEVCFYPDPDAGKEGDL